MKTQELVKAVALKTGGTQKDAKAHIDAIKEVVSDELAQGGSVELKGFVAFTTAPVAERTARNPKTGEDVTVPAHTKARASLSKSLRKF